MRVVDFGALGQLLAIGDLRRADIGVDLVSSLQDVDLDVEMEFPHPLQDGLPGLRIGGDPEGRVFRSEFGERDTELFLVGFRFRLDRDLDDGLGEFHLFQNDRLLKIAERVAGPGILQASQRDDVAGEGFLDVFAIVGVHQQHAADAFPLVLGRVEHGRAGTSILPE